MTQGAHCFDILLDGKLPGAALPGVIVVAGDDGFLRRETAEAILALSKIELDDTHTYDGEECHWIDVHDELATPSLFGTTQRVCLISAADKLVKDSRPQLERWCDSAAHESLLILQLHSFPANTKLFKLVQKNGWCIDCALPTSGGRSKSPNMGAVKKWVQAWAKKKHGFKLSAPQASLVLDAVGPDCGILHQELAKLALYADDKGVLTDEVVRANVGSWRTRTMWEIADAVADGRTADALEQLQKVFAAGEHAAAVVPQIAWSLRRFGTAANLLLQAKRTGKDVPVKTAISASGFWGADVPLAEQRLRRMGLRKASKLLDWLLELDLKIKGTHSAPSRAVFALEELCLRLG